MPVWAEAEPLRAALPPSLATQPAAFRVCIPALVPGLSSSAAGSHPGAGGNTAPEHSSFRLRSVCASLGMRLSRLNIAQIVVKPLFGEFQDVGAGSGC